MKKFNLIGFEISRTEGSYTVKASDDLTLSKKCTLKILEICITIIFFTVLTIFFGLLINGIFFSPKNPIQNDKISTETNGNHLKINNFTNNEYFNLTTNSYTNVKESQITDTAFGQKSYPISPLYTNDNNVEISITQFNNVTKLTTDTTSLGIIISSIITAKVNNRSLISTISEITTESNFDKYAPENETTVPNENKPINDTSPEEGDVKDFEKFHNSTDIDEVNISAILNLTEITISPNLEETTEKSYTYINESVNQLTLGLKTTTNTFNKEVELTENVSVNQNLATSDPIVNNIGTLKSTIDDFTILDAALNGTFLNKISEITTQSNLKTKNNVSHENKKYSFVKNVIEPINDWFMNKNTNKKKI